MPDDLKDLIDRAIVRMEEHYDFYMNDDASQYIGDVTIDEKGHCYGVSLLAEHCEIEQLLEARAKVIREGREARYARIEAALRFYADERNWELTWRTLRNCLEESRTRVEVAAVDDRGEIARKALGETP